MVNIQKQRQVLELKSDALEAVAARHRVSLRITGGTLTPRHVEFHCAAQVGTKVSAVTALVGEFAAAIGTSEASVHRQGATIVISARRNTPRPQPPNIMGAMYALRRDADAPLAEICSRYNMSYREADYIRSKILERRKQREAVNSKLAI